jgi:hypothetical protein
MTCPTQKKKEKGIKGIGFGSEDWYLMAEAFAWLDELGLFESKTLCHHKNRSTSVTAHICEQTHTREQHTRTGSKTDKGGGITSLLFQSPLRTSFSSCNNFKTFCTMISSSFFCLTSRDCPPRLVIFLSASRCFSTNSMSFIRSSSEIIPRSRQGSTSPKEISQSIVLKG